MESSILRCPYMFGQTVHLNGDTIHLNNQVTHLNLFKSISVATGNTLSRVHSPTSMASHELHKKCHFCPVSMSWTITLLTYLNSRYLRLSHCSNTNCSFEMEWCGIIHNTACFYRKIINSRVV